MSFSIFLVVFYKYKWVVIILWTIFG